MREIVAFCDSFSTITFFNMSIQKKWGMLGRLEIYSFLMLLIFRFIRYINGRFQATATGHQF